MKKACEEIKSFVSNYWALREVERRAIRELGLPIQCMSVHDTLREILHSKMHLKSTERYTGGSRERAVAEVGTSPNENGAKKLKILDRKACAWCGGRLPEVSLYEGVESTYCSQECAETGRLKRGGMYASTRIRSQVFTLEHGLCAKCGIDANGKSISCLIL